LYHPFTLSTGTAVLIQQHSAWGQSTAAKQLRWDLALQIAACKLHRCTDEEVAMRRGLKIRHTAPIHVMPWNDRSNDGREATCSRPGLLGMRRSCSECGRKKKSCDGQQPCG
ncbi:unnamed protein product, partial [Ectocarpus sp. 13 AM-2016]